MMRFLPARVGPRLRGRFHAELASAGVTAFTASFLWLELSSRLLRLGAWETIVRRNEWFQKKALEVLDHRRARPGPTEAVLCYSYAARSILQWAKRTARPSVLAQIDPGPVEEEIVAAAHERHPEFASRWQRAPADYWRTWREECAAADRIVVNSEWCKAAMIEAGIDASKLSVVALGYEPSGPRPSCGKRYPSRFSTDRPLRVLFLGSVNLRKGIAELHAASGLVADQNIEFRIVGPQDFDHRRLPTVNRRTHWLGPVARNETRRHYEWADVFVFPTLSDGFGLTQLEAASWGLPIVTSSRCGKVVTDGENGIVLRDVTSEALANALSWARENPAALEGFSANALEVHRGFTTSRAVAGLRQTVNATDDHE
jgi:glycosyltransferase involved in cell wall biosynthesis